MSLLQAEVCGAEGGLWRSEEPRPLLMFASVTISLQPQRGGLQSGRELKMSVTVLKTGDEVSGLLGGGSGCPVMVGSPLPAPVLSRFTPL